MNNNEFYNARQYFNNGRKLGGRGEQLVAFLGKHPLGLLSANVGGKLARLEAAQRGEKTPAQKARIALQIAAIKAKNQAARQAAAARQMEVAMAGSKRQANRLTELNRQRRSLYNNKNREEFNRRLSNIRSLIKTINNSKNYSTRTALQKRLKNMRTNMKKFVSESLKKAQHVDATKYARAAAHAREAAPRWRKARRNALVKKFVNKLKARRLNARQTNETLENLVRQINNESKSNAALNNLLKQFN